MKADSQGPCSSSYRINEPAYRHSFLYSQTIAMEEIILFISQGKKQEKVEEKTT
jgi:hypothetical protein